MKYYLTTCLLIFCLFETIRSQPVFITKSGEVVFFSEAPLENIEGHNTSPNSILNTSTNEIAFIITIRGFRFEKDLMQEHFNEKYLESDKFPQATFKGRITDSLDWQKPGTYPVNATGTLNIHGVEKNVNEKGTLTIKENELELNCKMRVAIADYNISIPKLLFQNIADTVDVQLHINYVPYTKKSN